MFNTKNIVLLIILICCGIGYYAWQQQKASLNGLELAKKQGAKIDFFLRSRPLFAVDSTHKSILLVYSDKTLSVKFSEIKTIRFIETPYKNNYDTEPKGPDTIMITLNDGNQYRVGDLRNTAREAITQFQSFAPEIESILKNR